MRKILVVGGNGFIGAHLVDSLVRGRNDVTIVDRQARRYEPVPMETRFIRGDLSDIDLQDTVAGFDAVCHLAWSGIHENSNRNPIRDVEANLLPTFRLIDACIRQHVKRFVFMSSGGTVYGPTTSLPTREDQSTDPLSVYGINKLAVEKYLHMCHELYGLDYVVLRPSVPYGPGQDPLGRQGAVAVFLYRIALGFPIDIWGDGSTARDFFYIDDLVKALQASIELEFYGERIFNIAGDEVLTLLELVALIEQTVGKKAAVNFYPSRKFDSPGLSLDTSRARRVLDWSPTVQMAEGLRRTWKWQTRHF